MGEIAVVPQNDGNWLKNPDGILLSALDCDLCGKKQEKAICFDDCDPEDDWCVYVCENCLVKALKMLRKVDE